MPPRESTNPKYLQIARALREEIASKYVAGDYLPSERVLSTRFGVTVKTVRHALRQLEAEGLVQTLPFRGTLVLPQIAAVTLPKPSLEHPSAFPSEIQPAAARSNIVALVVPLESFTIAVIVRGVERELRKHGYRLQLCGLHTLAQIQANTTAAQAYERMVLESLEDDPVAGVIWWSTFGYLNRDVAQRLQTRGLPIVLIDSALPKLACDWVGIDDYHAAYQATQYLQRLGHQHIAFWGFELGEHIPPVDGERLAGFMDALQQDAELFPDAQARQPVSLAGLPRAELACLLPPEMLHRIFFFDRDTVDALLACTPRPTAVLVANDQIAISFVSELEKRGIRVPEEMAVVSFADINRYTGRAPRLTTVRQPFEQMAQRAVRVLMMRLRDPSAPLQHLFLPTQLIIRESCGGAQHASDRSEAGGLHRIPGGSDTPDIRDEPLLLI